MTARVPKIFTALQVHEAMLTAVKSEKFQRMIELEPTFGIIVLGVLAQTMLNLGVEGEKDMYEQSEMEVS